MEAKSLRMQQKKLQRVKLLEREMFSSPPMPLDIPAYSPIFLSPSSLSDHFTPSPSPLPAAGGNHSLPKAAIIGGSVAGVVALAVTATVISTVAGKVGASCLLGPAINLFSCLFQKFFTPCASKLKSLCSTLNRCKAGSKKKAAADDDDDDDAVDDLYTIILGGSPNAAAKAESEAAATYSLATSPLRDVVKGGGNQPVTSAHEFLAASLSEFAESELKKQKAMMMQAVNEQTAKAQGYAESLIFSVTGNIVSDELGALKKAADAHLTEVSQLKANTDLMKASTETIAAVWKHPEDVAITIFDETIRAGAEKIKNTIAHESEEGIKKLQNLREKVALQEEVVLQGLLGKAARTSSKESHESGEEEAKQEVKGVEYIVESASDAYEEVQSEENMDQRTKLADAPHKKDEERGEGDAAKHHINSASRVAAATGGGEGAIVPVPSKALAAATSREDAVQGKRTTARKAKRPSNLGHVSFSCEMSAYRLRFFTSCRSGGTYGSPPPSPSPRPPPHHYSHPYDRSIITGSHDVYSRNGGDYHSTIPLYNSVHLAPATRNHFHLMHQQYQPAQSILLQSNAAAHDPPLAQHTASLPHAIDNTPRAGSPSPRLHYGSPFDGVL